MENQLISIDFGQGLDTKTDPKLVIPAKFQVLKDGIFTNAKRVSKRNGYDSLPLMSLSGSLISSPHMVAQYKNELVCAATDNQGTNRLWSFSESLQRWNPVGEYNSVSVSKQIINASRLFGNESHIINSPFYSTNCSSVVLGNIALYAFDNAGGTAEIPSFQGTYITVIDLQTGTHLANQVLTVPLAGGTTWSYSKAAIVGNNNLAVFGVNYNTGNDIATLYGMIITVNSSGVSLGAPVAIGTCKAKTPVLSSAFSLGYDVQNTATGCVVSVANEPNIDLYTLDTALSTTHTTTINSTGNINALTSLLDASGNIWVYWNVSSTLYYAIKSSTLTGVLGITTISAAASGINQITAINTDATHQAVYYSIYTSFTYTADVFYPVIKTSTVSVTGSVVTPKIIMFGMDLYTRPFVVNGITYIGCVTISQSQCTGVIIDVTNTTFNQTTDIGNAPIVAQFLPGEAEGIYSAGFGITGGSITAPSFLGTRYPGFLNTVQFLSPTKITFAAGFVIQLNQTVKTLSTNLQASPSLITNVVQMGVSGITLDFNHIDAYQAVVQQDTLVLNGGVVSMYDGAQVTELGFPLPPDNIALSPAASGGSISSGTYIYFVTWSWTDANGNLYESAPSPPVQAFFNSGSSNVVNIGIPLLQATTKLHNVFANIYRSDSNLGGNIAYLIATFAVETNGTNATFDDNLASSTVGEFQLYTQNGAILDNTAPPPAMIMWTNNNRLWVVDSENPETNIEYSKTASLGTGIAFSTGLLELVIDSRNGSIAGASPMDEKTVILKQNGIGYFIGDGANDSGTGSTITSFQFIPSDVGCSNSKSVISFPEGILFRSSTNKGIYLVSRGLQTGYFGQPVEAFNTQDIQSALITPSRNQIRFLTSSGFSLLYDYVMGQWSVFSNHTGLSSTIWQGSYVYVRTDGTIYQENTTSFLDNTSPYSLILETAWLPLSSVQNFQRAKQLLQLGDYQNGSSTGHGVQVQAAYDFNPTFGNAVPYFFGSASSSGVFQYRNFFSRQKCDTISLLISEVTTGVSGEFIDLSNMSFIAGMKKGGNKLRPGASVG